MIVPQCVVDFAHGLFGTAPGPIAIGRVVKLSLEDRLQYQLGRGLHNAITNRRDGRFIMHLLQ
jgi:hypothetical protein